MIPVTYYWWSFLMNPETWFILIVLIPCAFAVLLGYLGFEVYLEHRRKAQRRQYRREYRR